LWLAALSISAGCATTKPYQTTFDVPALALQETRDLTNAGVTVGLAPVTRENAAKFGLATEVRWREMNKYAAPAGPSSPMGGTSLDSPTVIRSGMLYLVPMPAFVVGIANKTGRELNLSAVEIQVVDNRQKSYPLVRQSRDLMGRLAGDAQGTNPHVAEDAGLMERLMTVVSQLPLLAAGVSIPNGELWQGYLVLDVDARNAKEYYDLMKPIQSFSVRLKNLPTQTQPADFEFLIEKTDISTSLTCPGDVKEPLPDKCAVNATPAVPAAAKKTPPSK
jgi:hypothetical protein